MAWVVGFLAARICAQEIKVDINAHNRPLSETADPAYLSWNTNASWFSGGSAITNTFSGVTFIFRHVGPTGTGLTTDRYPAGLTTPGWNAKLVSDGITVAPLHITNVAGSTNPGARIELTIRGLSAGRHTLLTWHNTWQNPSNYTFSPLHIYLNGVKIITNLPVSNRVTNNADAAYSYVEFVSDGTNDTVIAYEASTDFTVTDAQPCINGFELNTPNFRFKANRPFPAHADEHVDADATKSVLLRWTPAAIAVSHHVYFGTSSNAVKNATPASPEFLGNQTATNRLVTNLTSLATYYWRVDEVDATNGVTRGDVWMFRIRRLAFPGAEGYGRFAIGGRGGVVVVVTNLNDSGPGSLRDALTGNYGPRTVVFNVGGLITLESDLVLNHNHPYITIAGQTAPGKGICLRKNQFGVSGGRDLIIRHLRMRPGNLSGRTLNGTGLAGSDHCIMDHVSVSWSIDEGLSTRNSRNITFQRSIIAEALNIAGHQNYPPGTRHGYAASVGGDIASLHHNLLAHCEGRNWSLAGGLDADGRYAGRLDIFNNVVYNWRSRTTDGGAHQVNFVGNYYKRGPASIYSYALNAQYGNYPGTQQYFFTNNVMPGVFGYANQSAGRTYSTESGGVLPENSNPPYSAWVNAPFFPSHATIHHATNAYKQVLSDVGCNRPVLDDQDSRIIRETLDGTHTYVGSVSGSPGLPDSQNDVGGWEHYPEVHRPPDWDSDRDGLPDWWERIKGLNPNSPPGDFSDSNGDPDGDEFTNLEDYLNWLAAPNFVCTNGASVDIDLTQFTRGFTNNSPVYAVFAATHGTVALVSNGRVARFTSTATTNALGSFTFSVVDADGDGLTNTVGLRLVASAAPRLGMRRDSGALFVEVAAEPGRAITVETATNIWGGWSDWTNVVSSAGVHLLPVSDWAGEPHRFFRARTQ
ncbi:MAG: T9SS C-terminal target domain-containing protein [Verrucomicrobiae bacterium]|nr:T9SS C-terminal target domain-containing protein [Verrucomicrobiae bacterium]